MMYSEQEAVMTGRAAAGGGAGGLHMSTADSDDDDDDDDDEPTTLHQDDEDADSSDDDSEQKTSVRTRELEWDDSTLSYWDTLELSHAALHCDVVTVQHRLVSVTVDPQRTTSWVCSNHVDTARGLCRPDHCPVSYYYHYFYLYHYQ